MKTVNLLFAKGYSFEGPIFEQNLIHHFLMNDFLIISSHYECDGDSEFRDFQKGIDDTFIITNDEGIFYTSIRSATHEDVHKYFFYKNSTFFKLAPTDHIIYTILHDAEKWTEEDMEDFSRLKKKYGSNCHEYINSAINDV